MKTKKINTDFICTACGEFVSPHAFSCRNHCHQCLHSLHVDAAVPGDRLSQCLGIMIPKAQRSRNGKTQIQHICTTCKKSSWNIISDDDNRESIVSLRTLL